MMLSLPALDLNLAAASAWSQAPAAIHGSNSSYNDQSEDAWESLESVAELQRSPVSIDLQRPRESLQYYEWAYVLGTGVTIGHDGAWYGNSAATFADYAFRNDSPLGHLDIQSSSLRGRGGWLAVNDSQVLVMADSPGSAAVIQRLDGVQDGWNGAHSLAPSLAVKRDVAAVLSECTFICREPTIEVDDDGGVALMWEEEDKSFALTFFGNGKVIGTLVPRVEGYRPWSAEVRDAEVLRRNISALQVYSLVA